MSINSRHSVESLSRDILEEIYHRNCRFPNDINEHLPTIHRYANLSNSVVQFGVREGISTSALLSSSSHRVVSYDMTHNSNVERYFEYANLSGKSCVYAGADSRLIDIEMCDMLFIDTEHTYDQLSVELSRHHHNVRNFIVMHDTVSYPELNRAIDEFLCNNPQWQIHETFDNNGGLTVLSRKDQLITVVVPTMWKAQSIFESQLKMLIDCDLISEIIIYNNDVKSTPDWELLGNKKVTLLTLGDEHKNYYVNPCWNAGVERSITQKVCIMNDDIAFDIGVIDAVFNKVQPSSGVFGIVADADRVPMINGGNSIFFQKWMSGWYSFGFGQLMFLHKNNWNPIIDGLDVYYGDNFIFNHHLSLGLDNYLIRGLRWYSPLASTTRSKKVTDFHKVEHKLYQDWIKENKIPTTQAEIDIIKQGNHINIVVVCDDINVVKSKTVTSLLNMSIPDNHVISFDYVLGNELDNVEFNLYNYIFVVEDGYVVSEDALNEMMNILESEKDLNMIRSCDKDGLVCGLVKRKATDKIKELLSRDS